MIEVPCKVRNGEILADDRRKYCVYLYVVEGISNLQGGIMKYQLMIEIQCKVRNKGILADDGSTV